MRKIIVAVIAAIAVMVGQGSVALAHDPAPPQQIVWIGDSITAGWLVAPSYRIDKVVQSRLCGLSCPLGAPAFINDGVGGQALISGPGDLSHTFPGILAGMRSGDILLLDIGMNDLFSYAGDGAWTAAYVNIVTSAMNAGVHVIVQDITPVGPGRLNVELLRQKLNQWILDHFGAAIDMQTSTVLHCQTSGEDCNGQTWMDRRFGWPDQIHVNEGGYQIWADMTVTRLRQLGWLVGV